MAKKTDHTGFRNRDLFCYNCGSSQTMPLLMSVQLAGDFMKSFSKLHRNCPPTWKQPVPTEGMTTAERAQFWISHGEKGASSQVMWDAFILRSPKRVNHPCDPDDFRRCHLLLEMVPEWRGRMDKLKELSTVWTSLVDNWDRLTELLKEQLAGKKNNMYEEMKKLGC